MPRTVAVRGAITVPVNTAVAIRESTARLLRTLLDRNELDDAQIVSAVFTATPDLDADFPAHAARMLGWTDVPLLGAQEIAVPGALPRVVRVLLTVDGLPEGKKLEPAYLEGAAALRPDLVGAPVSSETTEGHRSSRPQARYRVAIIGVGQIGGSIGLALGRGADWWRVGYDLDDATLEQATDARAIDESALSLERALRDVDLAVLATPVDTLPELIEKTAAIMPQNAVLVDTGSARGRITDALRLASKRVKALGAHPLAGSDGSGFGAARVHLFENAPLVLCLESGEPPAIVRELVKALGAQEVIIDAASHDRALARTSHLPYLVSRALRDIGQSAADAGLSGPGFRDMTRLARSDTRMAQAYCRENAQEIEAAWRELKSEMERRVAALRSSEKP